MASNYVIAIKSENGTFYFGGWGQLGDMKIAQNKGLAYRFTRTLAVRNLEKVQSCFGKPCEVLALG